MARFGVAATHVGKGESTSASVYLGVTTSRLAVAATWMQSRIVRGVDVVDLGPTGAAMLEASVVVYDNVFAFAHVRRGFRLEAGGLQPVVDWVTGIGCGGATDS